MDHKETSKPETQATKPTAKKTVVVKKNRYFVPSLGRSIEAADLDEVAEIVKKETATPKGKGEITKG